MGNRFSTDQNHSEILVRDKDGRLKLYKDTHSQAQACNPLPLPMEPGVSYMFLASNGFHAHPYFDNLCETPANDLIEPETSLGGKNLNVMNYAVNTNARYFEINRDLPNKPDHPIFYRGSQGSGEERKTTKRAFNHCTPVPFPIGQNSPISFSHNNTPLIFYTDDTCQNEYVIPLTSESSVNPRTVENTLFDVPYTKFTSNTNPSETTNAMYYRTFRDKYE
jgi:hypothetical protein